MKGNPADPRMRAASKGRGIEITSISRPIRPSDFRDFDVILSMDKQNRGKNQSLLSSLVLFSHMWLYECMCSNVYVNLFVEDIMKAFNSWKFRDALPDDAHKKVSERAVGFRYGFSMSYCLV